MGQIDARTSSKAPSLPLHDPNLASSQKILYQIWNQIKIDFDLHSKKIQNGEVAGRGVSLGFGSTGAWAYSGV
jgi:hypothetical protein